MINFTKALPVGNELQYVNDSISRGKICGNGDYGRKCEELIAASLGKNSAVLLTTSCTHALEMSAILLNLAKGDEVIMPSFTFVSTATAFALHGARPVFADIREHDLNIHPSHVASLINRQTKAIVIVHYAGVACDMNSLLPVAALSNIPLIEDAAHALGGSFAEQALGSFGTLATFSFHETKNISCGEGGALVVNRPDLLERAHVIREKGTNRRSFQRGDSTFYTWVDAGSSYVVSDILAAYLYGQLENMPVILDRRRELFLNYCNLLLSQKETGNISFNIPEKINESTAHIFYFLTEDRKTRDALKDHLLAKGICAVFHYQPLHLSPYVTERWGRQPPLPVTENIASRLLRLPLYHTLTLAEQEYIADAIAEFFSGMSKQPRSKIDIHPA